MLLERLGDDSPTYYWRVLAAEEIMRLYRDDPTRLQELDLLHGAKESAEEVLHPPSETVPPMQPTSSEPGRATRFSRFRTTQLPLASRKLWVVTDWTVSLCFRRDIAELSMLGHARGLSREGREAASTISVTSSTRGGEGVD